VASRRALQALKVLANLDLKHLLRILAQPPPLPRRKSGRLRAMPFVIPTTHVRTTYELWVPTNYDPKEKLPLWIGIHGTGGNGAQVLAALRGMLGPQSKVLLAAATEAPDLHGRGWGYSHRERMLQVGLIDEIAKSYPVDRERVVVMGWSRGGHGTFDIGNRFPDRFAAFGPIIGSVPVRDRSLLGNFRGARVMVVNGARDQPALVRGVKVATARLAELGVEVTAILDPARGHVGFYDHLPELFKILGGARRGLLPRKLDFATWDKRYVRNRYIKILGLSSKVYHPGRPIKAKGASHMSEQAKRNLVGRYIREHTARVQVEVAQNHFKLHTHLVTRLALYLPLQLIDFQKPLQITLNGRLRKRAWHLKPPAPWKLLKLMREFGGADPGFRFAGKLVFNIH